MDKKAVAHHEAGHAVAAIRLFVPFKYVTIIQAKDSLGHVRFNSDVGEILKKLEVEIASPSDRIKIEKSIIIDFCGFYSEKKFTGKGNRIGATKDWEDAYTKADKLYGSSSVTEAYLKFLAICAEELVSDKMNWSIIVSMVDMLLKDQKLTYAKCIECFKLK